MGNLIFYFVVAAALIAVFNETFVDQAIVTLIITLTVTDQLGLG
jgi:hypothetical protein